MGTTLNALAAGGAITQWVAAIEGCEYLLTDGDPAAAVSAWAGTDWSSALPGLIVIGQQGHSVDPWDPFPSGGTLTLSVQPDSTQDTFGVLVAKTADNVDSELTAELNATGTTITVRDSGQFAAAPGTLFIGTECITYSAKPTTTTLTASARGKFSPFKANTESTTRFGRAHRIGLSGNRVNVPPIVTQEPRSWVGRWVDVRMHVRGEGGLNTRAEALCVWAGKIVEVSDSSDTGCALIQVKHALDVIGETAVGRDFYGATIRDGIYITGSEVIKLRDYDGTTIRNANNFSPTSGYTTAAEFMTELNTWMIAEKAAARVAGNYGVSPAFNPDGESRTKIAWRISVAAASVNFWLSMPKRLFSLLGFGSAIAIDADMTISDGPDTGNTNHAIWSDLPPAKKVVSTVDTFGVDAHIDLINEVGVFADQTASMPPPVNAWTASSPGLPWGLFMIGGALVAAAYSGSSLYYVSPISRFGFDAPDELELVVRDGEDDSGLSVRQMFAIAGNLSTLLPQFLLSTGTTGYNHATHDTLPSNIGAAIPWDVLGNEFVSSCNSLGTSAAAGVVIIDKPTTFKELFGADLILRGVSFVWKAGGIRMAQWASPAGTTSLATLTEDNKASPAGVQDAQRSATTTTDQWMFNSIKVEHGRGFGDETYTGAPFIVEDVGSMDDFGSEPRTKTISMRNSVNFGQYTSGAVDDAIPDFIARLPMFSRPIKKIRRTISPDLYEQLAPLDVVTIVDNFARDPSTGLRGTLSRLALVISNSHDWGGPEAGGRGKRELYGEVDLLLVDIDRAAKYSPAADIDDTASTGGFTAGYNSATPAIQCYRLKNSEPDLSIEGAHDASYFSLADAVRIIEIDPAVTASPLAWTRTIVSVVGDVVTLSSALTAPAFDVTKKYRMIPQYFTSCTATQKVKAFQCDDADGRILNAAPAFTFSNNPATYSTDETYSNLPERHADLLYGDGAPLDAGSERALIRMVNHLVGNVTKIHAGNLFTSAMSGATVTGTDWLCVHYEPIFLGAQVNPVDLPRKLRCGLLFRSNTAAQTGNARITLSRFPPGSVSSATPLVNMLISKPASVSSVLSTTSTTFVQSADVDLDITPITPDGEAWLIIEVQQFGQTWGANKAYMKRLE